MTKRSVFLAVLIFCWSSSVLAAEVPRYYNYQATIYDDGGNPVPDGVARLNFRLFDSKMNLVYEEFQDTNVRMGMVTVMVGEGQDVKTGGPTGGVPAEVVLPDGPRYMEVQAEGYPAEGLMELVSVPYAQYADIALSVREEAIGSTEIKDGSVGLDDLSETVITAMSEKIVGGDGGVAPVVIREEFDFFRDSISGQAGASEIGVRPDFTYSSADKLQRVLGDLDIAIKKRAEDVKIVGQNMSGIGSQVDQHINDMSNPHGVSASQIGAVTGAELGSYVSESELFSDQKIKSELIPDDVARVDYVTEVVNQSVSLEQVGSGGIVQPSNLWEKMPDTGNAECTFTQTGTRKSRCLVDKQEHACGQGINATFDYEMVTAFSVNYLECGYPGGISGVSCGPAEIEIKKQYMHAGSDGAGKCHVARVVEIEFGNIGYAGTGSTISWQFYKRPLLQ